jgi:hypothetical protein
MGTAAHSHLFRLCRNCVSPSSCSWAHPFHICSGILHTIVPRLPPGLGSPPSDARLLQDLFGQLMSGLCYLVRRLYNIRQQCTGPLRKGLLPRTDGRRMSEWLCQSVGARLRVCLGAKGAQGTHGTRFNRLRAIRSFVCLFVY